MRLKRLELFGFKSFADRTVLDFETRLSGIVGPNGCGKSNVVDAIRWVLGETRPTSMRGDEMTDVIFKGSVSRPAMSVAEVSMVLDNQEGTIEDRGPEVSVTRRVFQAGEGEYLIDGIQVRRKDVREMLFDTGLGSRGYSVLEQGKIDAVLSANPIDRRAIFEEAAGISRYRQRRKEAESRLARVEADLVRLEDVVGELDKRSRSLKLQAGKARRFVEARDVWRAQGERLARHQVHELDGVLTGLRQEIASLEERERAMREERGALERDTAAREEEQRALAAELERAAAESSDLAGDVRALDERAQHLLARIAGWEAAALEETQRAEGLAGRLEERRAERARMVDALAELEAGAARARATVEREGARAREVQRSYAEARADAQARGERVLHLLHERTSARNAVEHHEQALKPLEERLSRAKSRREEAVRSLAAAQAAEGDAALAVQAAEAALAEAEAHRAEFEREADELEREVTSLDSERGRLGLERARLASRVESLLDRERELEGLDAGARAVVEAAAGGEDAPALTGELRGLVADHLRTRSKHARALDSVLGARSQALVLGARDDAARVLAWLKERRGGLVSLALPEGLAAGAFASQGPRPTPPSLRERDGVEGALRGFVTPAPGFEALADLLLDGVFVVRDVDLALEFVLEHPELRFVTLEGDLVESRGVVGGHREVAQGPVGRRAYAADLEAGVREAEAEIAALTARLEGVLALREEKRRGLGALLEELSQKRLELAEAKSAGDAARARAADLAESAEIFRREEEEIGRERTRLAAELEAARARLEASEHAFSVANAELEQAETARRELEAQREELARIESHARVEATRAAEKAESTRSRLADLGRATEELALELERAKRLVEEQLASAEAGRAESGELVARRAALVERRAEVDALLEAARERERAVRVALEELRRRGEALTRELELLLAEAGARRLEEQKSSLARDDIRRRAEEDFGLAPEKLLEGFVPEEALLEPAALAALAHEVADLRGQMDRLGPVNLEAMGELEEVSQRLEFLTKQRDDLVQGRRSLENTIRAINQESERLFLEAFEDIRKHFQATFRQLFGGGRADVALAEGAPALEAGIEITARPPGRETLPISLLSGGQRTMTALALLFAVFRSRPSPFCVLDEVDAALDDANISRFLGLLDTFKADTQFVLVTHNKGSMAACDRLYGVTMAVRGVSNVVSVELADVDEFVPEATGSADARASLPEAAPEEDDVAGEPLVELVPLRATPRAEHPESANGHPAEDPVHDDEAAALS